MKNIIRSIFFILPIVLFGRGNVNVSETTPIKQNGNINLYVGAGTFGVVTHVLTNIEGRVVSSRHNKRHVYFRGSYGQVIAFTGGSGTSSSQTETESVVLGLTFLTGKGKHHFDTSTGIVIRDDEVWPLLELGYRFQKIQGGLLFRAKIGFLGMGLGVGYSF